MNVGQPLILGYIVLGMLGLMSSYMTFSVLHYFVCAIRGVTKKKDTRQEPNEFQTFKILKEENEELRNQVISISENMKSIPNNELVKNYMEDEYLIKTLHQEIAQLKDQVSQLEAQLERRKA